MTGKTLAHVLQVSIPEVEQALERARAVMSEKDFQLLNALAVSYAHISQLIQDKQTTIAKLHKLLFGQTSEKTKDVLPKAKAGTSGAAPGSAAKGGPPSPSAADAQPDAAHQQAPADAPRAKGHGRNGAKDYPGATRACVEHDTLRPGGRCPECKKGKVYRLAEPKVIVRITGGPPLQAQVWEIERLRCNLCSEIFTAKKPDGVDSDEKYDATAASMIGLLRYGSGLPFNRLARLEQDHGIPLPASTQWDLMKACAEKIKPAYEELVRQAAQGEVVHNDDTSMEILALRTWLRERPIEEDDERTGIFTSGIISRVGERTIAIFATGRKHAGENLADLLQHRKAASPPIQMCDGLARNLPKQLAVVLSNCLAHGRRQFINVVDNFPTECQHVLEALRKVYHHDADAKKKEMSPATRLAYHQEHSGPVMAALKLWLEAQFAERKVEPNSGLGKAINYLLKRWDALTLFLRAPGAPLDNNVCERALKQAIVHRKNSLFYRTENGARVGDIFMSLIHTARLSKVNPFDYLTALQRHAADVASNPTAWLP
jgi:transposase